MIPRVIEYSKTVKTITDHYRTSSKRTITTSSINLTKQKTQEMQKRIIYKAQERAVGNFNEAQKMAIQIVDEIGARTANVLSNQLLIQNAGQYRTLTEQAVLLEITQETPYIKKETLSPNTEVVGVFRSVTPTSVYGDPSRVFEEGMPASVFDQTLGIRKAEIISYTVNDGNIGLEPNRPDRLGFVFGPNISTTLYPPHAFQQRFTTPKRRFLGDCSVIYLIAAKEGYNIARAIDTETGFIRNKLDGMNGKKGTSCSEDAREIALGPYIPPETILGARWVDKNGNVGPFIRNKNAEWKLFENIKNHASVQMYLETKTLEEMSFLEVLMKPAEEIENAQKIMTKYLKSNEILKHRIRREILYGTNYNEGILSDEIPGYEKQYFHFFTTANSLKNNEIQGTEVFDKAKKFPGELRETVLDAARQKGTVLNSEKEPSVDPTEINGSTFSTFKS